MTVLDTQQRLKDLETDRDWLWNEARALRKRINQQWSTMVDRPMPGEVIGRHLALPGLRAFWSMSGIESAGVACALPDPDYSLTNNNTVEFGFTGVAPWAKFGGTNEYLSRGDISGLDLAGTETYIASDVRGVTIGGWFYFDNTASANENCIAKWGAAGQRSYRVIRNVEPWRPPAGNT